MSEEQPPVPNWKPFGYNYIVTVSHYEIRNDKKGAEHVYYALRVRHKQKGAKPWLVKKQFKEIVGLGDSIKGKYADIVKVLPGRKGMFWSALKKIGVGSESVEPAGRREGLENFWQSLLQAVNKAEDKSKDPTISQIYEFLAIDTYERLLIAERNLQDKDEIRSKKEQEGHRIKFDNGEILVTRADEEQKNENKTPEGKSDSEIGIVLPTHTIVLDEKADVLEKIHWAVDENDPLVAENDDHDHCEDLDDLFTCPESSYLYVEEIEPDDFKVTKIALETRSARFLAAFLPSIRPTTISAAMREVFLSRVPLIEEKTVAGMRKLIRQEADLLQLLRIMDPDAGEWLIRKLCLLTLKLARDDKDEVMQSFHFQNCVQVKTNDNNPNIVLRILQKAVRRSLRTAEEKQRELEALRGLRIRELSEAAVDRDLKRLREAIKKAQECDIVSDPMFLCATKLAKAIESFHKDLLAAMKARDAKLIEAAIERGLKLGLKGEWVTLAKKLLKNIQAEFILKKQLTDAKTRFELCEARDCAKEFKVLEYAQQEETLVISKINPMEWEETIGVLARLQKVFDDNPDIKAKMELPEKIKKTLLENYKNLSLEELRALLREAKRLGLGDHAIVKLLQEYILFREREKVVIEAVRMAIKTRDYDELTAALKKADEFKGICRYPMSEDGTRLLERSYVEGDEFFDVCKEGRVLLIALEEEKQAIKGLVTAIKERNPKKLHIALKFKDKIFDKSNPALFGAESLYKEFQRQQENLHEKISQRAPREIRAIIRDGGNHFADDTCFLSWALLGIVEKENVEECQKIIDAFCRHCESERRILARLKMGMKTSNEIYLKSSIKEAKSFTKKKIGKDGKLVADESLLVLGDHSKVKEAEIVLESLECGAIESAFGGNDKKSKLKHRRTSSSLASIEIAKNAQKGKMWVKKQIIDLLTVIKSSGAKNKDGMITITLGELKQKINSFVLKGVLRRAKRKKLLEYDTEALTLGNPKAVVKLLEAGSKFE